MAESKHPNRLINESSPYLLQHAHNPVDWYPWGSEALERSKTEEKLIFLSIGYSACHWCHVMEKESFENSDIASLMNANFINIKVDREERPDLDHVYMTAIQVMTQRGGWPMSVFLTPELEPIYGGTYFPPTDRGGMPGFNRILTSVASLWKKKREEVTKSAKELTAALSEIGRPFSSTQNSTLLSHELVSRAVTGISNHFDHDHGGFGEAPKFFHTMDLRLLMRVWYRTRDQKSLEMVTATLTRMAEGGIYDQLGGGFHRYSTDRVWLVPHFEKMLYDNALLAETYLEAFQITQDPLFFRVATETLDYILREMKAPEGGYFSTEDADTEGEEGKSFVWTQEEICQRLGPKDFGVFSQHYETQPNWEGKIILRMLPGRKEDSGQICRPLLDKLFSVRTSRPQPFRDEKIIVSWNGMMIKAMSTGFQTLGDDRYLKGAIEAVDFILQRLWITIHNVDRKEHSLSHLPVLLHSYKGSASRTLGFLDDYASLILGLLSLYECDFNARWVESAIEITNAMIHQFWDDETSSFLYTGKYHERLLIPVREIQDGATPSGTGLAVSALLHLGRLTSTSRYLEIGEKVLSQMAPIMGNSPTATSQTLLALEFFLSQPTELALIRGKSGDEFHEVLKKVRSRFWPHRILAATEGVPSPSKGPIPFLENKSCLNGRTTLYWCHQYTCQKPLVAGDDFDSLLSKAFNPAE